MVTKLQGRWFIWGARLRGPYSLNRLKRHLNIYRTYTGAILNTPQTVLALGPGCYEGRHVTSGRIRELQID